MMEKLDTTHGFIKILFAFLFALIFLPTIALSEETYVFERMWPTLQQPWYFDSCGIDIDANSNVWVADYLQRYMIQYTPAGKLIRKWPINTGDFLSDFAIDKNGFFFLLFRDRVEKRSPSGKIITQWGGGISNEYNRNDPNGVTVDQYGNVYVADAGNHLIKAFSTDGTLISQWGGYGNTAGKFIKPTDVEIDLKWSSLPAYWLPRSE